MRHPGHHRERSATAVGGHAALQPHRIRNRRRHRRIRPRWATLPECVSNPASWPCSPRPRRSRSRPRSRTAAAHRTIIWIVVDGDDAFVRSVNGATARWYREAVANPAVTIHARRRRAAALARSRPSIPTPSQRTSDALVRKYAGRGGLRPMLAAGRPRHDPRDSCTAELTAMYFDEFKHQLPDIDPAETEDWIDVARPGRRRRRARRGPGSSSTSCSSAPASSRSACRR